MKTSTRSQLISVKEVATTLSLSVPTVWRQAKAGALPSPIKIGGSTRWRRSDIEAIFQPANPE
ncbi:AlpA family transcriptional regulator [Roseobacter sp. OBYS 0001]|uniref:helix-turn-helix transcriptional regulator n=1 Tax=Roseobacter sp. OBYS 0001 TaxID=882651 RepID=UPI001BC6592A|nr:helix-turn-helix domain-containing protein [Roseobacter sp. OBYS 0001]GIT88481.1 DNA-binding protein [Roseobacter sp. OBYS 0001]